MRSSSLNLLCRTANQLSRAATHPFSAISSPHPSKRLPSCRGGSPAADGAPSPHGEAARTQRAESTDEHACWITHLYFRKPLYFLAKHADFLQLLLEYSFPHARRCVRVMWFSFFSFTSSPTYCNAMIINAFGVKTFTFRLHPLPLTPGLHRTARKVYFSAGLFSKAREYRTATTNGEGKKPKPSPQTSSTSTDCAQWVKE